MTSRDSSLAADISRGYIQLRNVGVSLLDICFFPTSNTLSLNTHQQQDDADYIDLNLGCPQRIAKRGFYGAFLMEHQDLVQQLVSSAAAQLRTPVSVKIRLFSDLEETIAYAQMLERAGASLIAIHGRTREMKVGRVQGRFRREISWQEGTGAEAGGFRVQGTPCYVGCWDMCDVLSRMTQHLLPRGVNYPTAMSWRYQPLRNSVSPGLVPAAQ